VTGDNGQGKSLVARALSGALSMQGRAMIKGPQVQGTASLLFQDVLTQTLLRSFDTLAAGGPNVSGRTVRSVYAQIQNEYAAAFNSMGGRGNNRGDAPRTGRHSLLDIKTVLVAARLAAAPAALVLDEPDWGLSRRSAIAFVSAVLAAAHRQGTPVILISHKPWWRPAARSGISVTRTAAVRSAPSERLVFTITLHLTSGGP
jgi:energy-coupling factor transporter ATP-binding protein EcfA2